MKKLTTLLIRAFPYYFVILILLTLIEAYRLFYLASKLTFQIALDSGAILSIGTFTYTVILITSICFTKEKIYE